jgi:hypothetical protein
LAFLACLAMLQVVTGAVVLDAWRTRRSSASWTFNDEIRLDDMFTRLRDVELAVAIGAVLTVMLWSFAAVVNVRISTRRSRSPLLAMASWLISPGLVVLVSMFGNDQPVALLSLAVLAVEVAMLYLPFGLLGGATAAVGGSATPFRRWYFAVVLAFVIHQVFTTPFDLSVGITDADLRESAVLLLVNGIVIALMSMMASDATRALQHAAADRAFRHNSTSDDAFARFASSRSGDAGTASSLR